MYIEPNTNIRILKNVPLDNTYDHTLYFSDESSQIAYFQGMQKYDLVNYTYQRVNRGVARVGIKSDLLYDCNYIMFQNTNFGSKWFYAFITSVEYLNNETSEIKFEIDDMQTWFFDYHLDHCFVEREHSVTDAIGDNIIPENLSVGEYVCSSSYKEIKDVGEPCFIVAIVDVQGESGSVDGKIYDGIYGGATLYVYEKEKFNALNLKLSEYVQKPDSVVSIYTMPKHFLPGGQVPTNNTLPSYDEAVTETWELPIVNTADTLDGYNPKNNKMYTYPFNFCHVDNGSNASLSLRYEFFQDLHPKFQVSCNVTQPVQVSLRPIQYKKAGVFNSEVITLSNYPQCSWNVDSYAAWIAQNSVGVGLGLAGAVGGMVVGGLTGGAAGVLTGAISGIGKAVDLLAQDYQASIKADIFKGNASGNLCVSSRKQQFYGCRMSVTADYAKSIDDFFTRYGYATKKLKIPNRSSRPHWNYVKTVNCTITGSIPTDAARNICSIYDNGITFWKNGEEVGNYSLDNSPT